MGISRFAGVAILGLFLAGVVSAQSAESPRREKSAKKAKFDEVFGQWKVILGDLRNLRDQYRKAPSEKRPEIAKRYNALIQKGQELQPKVAEAAEAAYREDPKSQPEARDFLLGMLMDRFDADDFEEALRVAKILLDTGYENPMLDAWAGVAAFCVMDLDTAEKELKLAQEANIFQRIPGDLSKLGPMLITEIPYYRQAWKKEQQIRAAEAKANDLPRVLLKTTEGDIQVELFENEAPNTVANFISLVEKGFYNGTPFHRVLPMFMAQGGDPTGTGTGGPGYTIPDECHRPDYRVHFRGSLSMAKTAQPDTGGSQFFLTFRPTHHLDGIHTVFGRVIKGMDVLAKIKRRDPQNPQAPDPDKILEAKVLRKRPHPYVPKKIPGRSS